MAIEEHYLRVKNTIRQLGRRDSLNVIWAYCQYLQINDFNIPADVQVANVFLEAPTPQAILSEWTLELMAREVIRHADEEPRRGRSLRQWDTVAAIANELRALEGDIYGELVGGRHIHLELMRIAHRQFVWQKHRFNQRLIIKYYKLFNSPNILLHIKQATGLELREIYLIGMAYLGHFLENPTISRQLEVEIAGLTQAHFDCFLAFTSLGQNALAGRLRAEHALDEGFAYRYSSLREFPLIRISHRGQDEIICPIPTLLFWRITTGLYYNLKDIQGFPSAFGDSFEKYVGEILYQRITSIEIEILSEKEYHVGRFRKLSVDWIIQQGDKAALFVECKTKRLTWASKAGLTDLSALEVDIRKLAGAVVQVYKTIADYRADRYPHLRFVAARHIYPAVVTLEDWYFFGLDMPRRLAEAVRNIMITAGLPVAWLDEMPYLVMSIEELEMSVGVMDAVDIHSFISRKVGSPEFRFWDLSTYCRKHYPDAVKKMPELFKDEFEAMFPDFVH